MLGTQTRLGHLLFIVKELRMEDGWGWRGKEDKEDNVITPLNWAFQVEKQTGHSWISEEHQPHRGTRGLLLSMEHGVWTEEQPQSSRTKDERP